MANKPISIERIIEAPTLPSLPGVAVEVLELTRDANAPIRKMAEVVQNDPALTTKILKTVNSSFYALAAPCTSIDRAMTLLGMNTIRSLVLSFSLVECFGQSDDSETFDFEGLWRRAVYGGTAARQIALRTMACDPEVAFIAALLQDLGMLAAHVSLGKGYDKLVGSCEDHNGLPAIEKEAIGFDHAQIGRALAERWRLPDALLEPIEFHHQVDKASKRSAALARLVVLGNIVADILTDEEPDDAVIRFRLRAKDWFGLDEPSIEKLLQQVTDGARALAKLLQLETGSAPNLAKILGEAHERLIQHHMAVERETANLRQANETLARESMTDGLTGIGNRRCFDDALHAAFNQAQLAHEPMALLLFDIDHFKSINDTHGHQFGDRVLVDLSAMLVRELGDHATICRYGGEEFAVLFEGVDKTDAAKLAEALRSHIASELQMTTQPDGDGDSKDSSPPAEAQRVIITASIGVVCFNSENTQHFTSPMDLVEAADQALYVAKRAGRNCVRIYNSEAGLQRRKLNRAQSASPSGPLKVLVIANQADNPLLESLRQANQRMSKIDLQISDQLDNAVIEDNYSLVVCILEQDAAILAEAVRCTRNSLPVIAIGEARNNQLVESCYQKGIAAYLPLEMWRLDTDRCLRSLVEFWRFNIACGTSSVPQRDAA